MSFSLVWSVPLDLGAYLLRKPVGWRFLGCSSSSFDFYAAAPQLAIHSTYSPNQSRHACSYRRPDLFEHQDAPGP